MVSNQRPYASSSERVPPRVVAAGARIISLKVESVKSIHRRTRRLRAARQSNAANVKHEELDSRKRNTEKVVCSQVTSVKFLKQQLVSDQPGLRKKRHKPERLETRRN